MGGRRTGAEISSPDWRLAQVFIARTLSVHVEVADLISGYARMAASQYLSAPVIRKANRKASPTNTGIT
jgi:hypothetical protein